MAEQLVEKYLEEARREEARIRQVCEKIARLVSVRPEDVGEEEYVKMVLESYPRDMLDELMAFIEKWRRRFATATGGPAAIPLGKALWMRLRALYKLYGCERYASTAAAQASVLGLAKLLPLIWYSDVVGIDVGEDGAVRVRVVATGVLKTLTRLRSQIAAFLRLPPRLWSVESVEELGGGIVKTWLITLRHRGGGGEE